MSGPCIDNGSCIELSVVGSPGAIRATPILSPDDGNGLECRSNGLYGGASRSYVPYGGAFPGAPSDGDILDWNVTTDTLWSFRWNASAGSYRWQFCGGSPVTADNTGDFSVGAGATNQSCAYTIQYAGVYHFRFHWWLQWETDWKWLLNYNIGGGGDIHVANSRAPTSVGTLGEVTESWESMVSVGSPNQVVRVRTKNNGASTQHIYGLSMFITPVSIAA